MRQIYLFRSPAFYSTLTSIYGIVKSTLLQVRRMHAKSDIEVNWAEIGRRYREKLATSL
jgi:hypothetical protein